MQNKYSAVMLSWILDAMCATKLLPLPLVDAQLRDCYEHLLRYLHKMLRCQVADCYAA